MADAERVHAVRLISHQQPLRDEQVTLPAPGPGEVRVELSFGGVNPVDRYTAEGRVAGDGPLPRTLGAEASGHLGGRPVLVAGAGLGARRDGVWANAANVPERAVFPLPDGVDLQEAAAMGIAGLTTWHVVELAELVPGDRVLVLGASGGVGMTVLSLVAARGATVWGQTGNERKAAALRRQGAGEVVVTGADGLTEAVRALAPTVVIDPLGGPYTPAALAALAPRGRHVLFGTSAGPYAELHLQELYRSGKRLLGYGGLRLSDDERRAGLAAALAALAAGDLRIPVDRVLPLRAANDAFAALQHRDVAGKVLLDLSG